MSYVFDPRFSIYDSADTLEAWMLAEATEGDHPKPTTQKVHLATLARAKTEGAVRTCLECFLPLAISSSAIRCTTCAAKRKLEMDRHRTHLRPKINRKFVGAMPKLKPKPREVDDEPVAL